MTPSKTCLELIKEFEDLRLESYQDPAGVWTIGYGHTEGVKPGEKITEKQAEDILLHDLIDFSANVKSYDTTYHWTQNEYDALLSFAFNVGSIDQLTGYGKRSKMEIAEKMLSYVYAGTEKLQGLERRRKAEQALFQGGAPVFNTSFPTLRYGSEGDLVKIWQIFLKIPTDGIFGSITESAVRKWQALQVIQSDGIIGPESWGRWEEWLQKNSTM